MNPTQAYIDARATLFQTADDKDPFTRMHAIEALAGTLGQKAGGVFMQALSDDDPIVQFAAAMAVGETAYAPARETLVRMAKVAGLDKRVYCAVIYALHRLGNDEYTGDLGRLLFHREKDVRANAALVMGLIGEPSAIGPLKSLLSDEQDAAVQIQLFESLALLGDKNHAILLEAYTKGLYLEDRLIAIAAMKNVRSRASISLLGEMLNDRQPPRVRVAAACALAQMGEVDDSGYSFCVESVSRPRSVLEREYGGLRKIVDVDINSLQRMAAISLGWMKRQAAVDALHPLMQNSDPAVRVAAAMSILRILSVYETAAEEMTAKKPPVKKSGKKPPAKRPKLYSAGGKD